MYPSGESQQKLLEELYTEANVDPTTVSYMEAHGTGTKVGDPEELKSIDNVFCTNRQRPLLIGSVKSNIGHTESASGICSIIKVIIGMETGFIPPNLHFNTNRKGVDGLEKNRLIVVNEKMPWDDNNGLAGINNFGFGGSNGHVLLKWNEKVTANITKKNQLPKLVCISGRTLETCKAIFGSIVQNGFNEEHITLFHYINRYVLSFFLCLYPITTNSTGLFIFIVPQI